MLTGPIMPFHGLDRKGEKDSAEVGRVEGAMGLGRYSYAVHESLFRKWA